MPMNAAASSMDRPTGSRGHRAGVRFMPIPLAWLRRGRLSARPSLRLTFLNLPPA